MPLLLAAVFWIAASPTQAASSSHAGPAGCGNPVPGGLVLLGSSKSMDHVRSSAQGICSSSIPGATIELLQHESGAVKALSCIGPVGPEGPTLTWHENGRLATQGRMTSSSGNAELCGRWTRYFDNGELRDEGEWVGGAPAGVWKVRAKPGEPLGERSFAGPFERFNEWAVAGGLNYMIESNTGGASTRTGVPGPSIWVRRGVQWLPWLFLEANLGFNCFLALRTDFSGTGVEVSPLPVFLVNGYWTPAGSRFRIGLQVGAALSLSVSSGSGTGGTSTGGSETTHPFLLAAIQYALTPPSIPGSRWFIELAVSPPMGNSWFAQALIGKRW